MKRISLSVIIFILGLIIYAHPWKPSHYVIIDTDGGIDDMKALCLFLASPDVRVLAVTVSPGVLSAENAYIKVRSLLNSFYHEGIPVGINRHATFASPEYTIAKKFVWGTESGIDPGRAPDFLKVISDIFAFEKSKVSFICLGGMNSAAIASEKVPGFSEQVKDITWSCKGLNDTTGFNYRTDRAAATKMMQGSIPFRAVINSEEKPFYTREVIGNIGKGTTPYSRKVTRFLGSEAAEGHQYAFLAADDLVPMYLHFPSMFAERTEGNRKEVRPDDYTQLQQGITIILNGQTVSKNQVLKEFPLSPSSYFDDIKPYVDEILLKYGESEWVAGVLANELHRHLGVFAIIGVKMGIRAREYFNTGVDEFSAISNAGSIPPLSCMNDGVQVSTGATPGHGLLTVKNEEPLSPSVEFRYLNNTIRLTLKPELTKKISDELREINYVYGLDSNIYWELVRKNSIKYWRDLDRHEIFVIEVL